MKTTATFLRNRLIGSLMILLLSFTSYGKNKVTITVIEKETGNRIPFAIISILDKANNKPIGLTDMSGTITTTEFENGQVMTISSLGYSSKELLFDDKTSKIIVELEKGIVLKTVTITATAIPLISCGIGCYGIGYGCLGGSSITTIGGTVDIVPTNKIEEFKIYPNPSQGIIRLKTGFEDYIMEVFDCTGKQVQKFISTNDEQIINLQELKAGIYFCRITKESLSQTSRLVIN